MKTLQPTSMAGARGFTLIELMITVAIAAILAGIAFASYRTSVMKSRRTEAKTALMDLANRETKLYATTNTYSTTPSDLGYSGGAFPVTVGSGYYEVNAAVTAANGTTPASFTLTATPLGSQVEDTSCATFTLNDLGQQAATDSGGADSTASCW